MNDPNNPNDPQQQQQRQGYDDNQVFSGQFRQPRQSASSQQSHPQQQQPPEFFVPPPPAPPQQQHRSSQHEINFHPDDHPSQFFEPSQMMMMMGHNPQQQQQQHDDPNANAAGGDQYSYDQNTYDGQTTAEYSASNGNQIPDILYLNYLCKNAMAPRDSSEEAQMEAEESWEPVKEWLRTHTAEEVRDAAEQKGDASMTALHFACRNAPPADVINVFLSIAIETVQWPDNFGWLPIHYACACGADKEVIQNLKEAYPESATTIDKRGRTPLHFALGNSDPGKVVSPDVVVGLSSTGAASYADDNGMLPLHYACAYGASEEALYMLTDAYKDGITKIDSRGRTPLHFALSNAGRKAAPAAVRLLLSLNKNIVNSQDGGPLPLRVLAEFASTVRKDIEQRDSVGKCLEHLLHADPDPTADFFTALQSLPDWLQEQAVVMPVVQLLLNEKIAQRFPSAILMSDFYMQLMVVITYSLLVPEAIDRRFNENDDAEDPSIELTYLIPLYLGGIYFLFRELIQILSLISLRAFHIWFYDPSNWLNVVYVVVVYFWTITMQLGTGDRENFRTGAALSVIVLWLKLLGYLRFLLIDFAVFIGGVFYVVQRLAAFLVSLFIILVAFSQMFYTVFQQKDPYCTQQPNAELSLEELNANLQCQSNQVRPFCNKWDAFLRVFTMLLGEVDSSEFEDSKIGLWLFCVFFFLVVILLGNVLIAIVTDSYKVIQDQRAAIVFWTNRLDFIAEMDAIANGPWKKRVRQLFGLETPPQNVHRQVTFGQEFWKRLMELFEDDIDDRVLSVEFLCYTVLRIGVAVMVIPFWVILGLFTFGWFWPPQIREAVFTSTVFKHATDSEKQDELRRNQVKLLGAEVRTLEDDLMQELAIDRTHIVQMRSLVTQRKQEIQSEMKEIKRIVNLLFEQQMTT